MHQTWLLRVPERKTAVSVCSQNEELIGYTNELSGSALAKQVQAI